ncbi:MAG: endonuclease, partial [Polyangiales bacterium]
IPGEVRAFGACDFEVDPDTRRVEAAATRLGDIARAYLYMHHRYHIPLTARERARFLSWHSQDPPSPWEHRRAEAIHRLQGSTHPWLTPNAR